MIEYPWPEPPERTEARIRGLVSSVVNADELVSLRLEWVTPVSHHLDDPEAVWVALRLTVTAVGDDDWFQQEIWGPDWFTTWEGALAQLADSLEDWVGETRFAGGHQRQAEIPL